jgi:hypothetical protein
VLIVRSVHLITAYFLISADGRLCSVDTGTLGSLLTAGNVHLTPVPTLISADRRPSSLDTSILVNLC